MFAPFMLNSWIAATIVAVVAGVVGFFVVLRGASFLAHAVPHGAFAGAAGAVLVGLDPLVGLGLFAVGGALAITALGRRARADVATALALVAMLGLGALFLSRSTEYSAEIFALLFGQVLGVSAVEIIPMLLLGAVSVLGVAITYRPLLLSSVLPDAAPAQGARPGAMSVVFALLLACATTTAVPIVGALLMFTLLVGPPAAARLVARRPSRAMALSVALALVTAWSSIALAYVTDWPVGFFVTAVSAALYLAARLLPRGRRRPTSPALSAEDAGAAPVLLAG